MKVHRALVHAAMLIGASALLGCSVASLDQDVEETREHTGAAESADTGAEVLDQESGAFNGAGVPWGTSQMAQVFTPTLTGYLTHFAIAAAPCDDAWGRSCFFTLTLRTVDANGNPAASRWSGRAREPTPTDAGGNAFGWTTMALNAPPIVQAGTQYALTITPDWYMDFPLTDGNPGYAVAYYPEYSSWSRYGNGDDLAFTTWITPTSPQPAIPSWDFGGAFGYVGGNPVGGSSCPAGYTATQVLNTGYVDWPVSFCARPHQQGVDPLYDFGGMYGDVNGAQVPNPITGAASCPAGYTDLEVLGAANCDPYPLHVCYTPHRAGTAPAYGFGGMWGYVNGAPTTNPVTGAASCPAGYTDTQALGTNGVDYPLHFCWYAAPVPSWDFGGAFGYVGGNPVGGSSCPAGYTATEVLSTGYVDWPVFFCARPHQVGVDSLYDFGGMYGEVNGAPMANPITGAASCPAGYTDLEVLGAANCDPYPLHVCYAPHRAATMPVHGFGGMWGYVNGAPVTNPVSGGASCPAGYTDTQVLGTNGVDYPLHFCWY